MADGRRSMCGGLLNLEGFHPSRQGGALIPRSSSAPFSPETFQFATLSARMIFPRSRSSSSFAVRMSSCLGSLVRSRAKVRSLKTDYVFYNGAGNRMDARDLLRVFYPVMKKADVKRFRFHDLRHTFATRLVQAGADIYTVQKLGRWKTISMVMRYAHHHPESLRAGIEILDRVPAGVSTVLAQSANHAVAGAGSESAVSC